MDGIILGDKDMDGVSLGMSVRIGVGGLGALVLLVASPMIGSVGSDVVGNGVKSDVGEGEGLGVLGSMIGGTGG